MKLITYKEVSYEAANRNSTSTKKKRIEYLTELLTYSNADKIYIDEVGYSIATKREKGWSRKGRKAIGKIPVLKTPHVSVCVQFARIMEFLIPNMSMVLLMEMNSETLFHI